MKTHLVKNPEQHNHFARIVIATGAGNNKDQRRRSYLSGQGIFEVFVVPEYIGGLAILENLQFFGLTLTLSSILALNSTGVPIIDAS